MEKTNFKVTLDHIVDSCKACPHLLSDTEYKPGHTMGFPEKVYYCEKGAFGNIVPHYTFNRISNGLRSEPGVIHPNCPYKKPSLAEELAYYLNCSFEHLNSKLEDLGFEIIRKSGK